jgi:hypothetical protein
MKGTGKAKENEQKEIINLLIELVKPMITTYDNYNNVIQPKKTKLNNFKSFQSGQKGSKAIRIRQRNNRQLNTINLN